MKSPNHKNIVVRLFAAAFLALVMSSCVSTKNVSLSAKEKEAMRGRTVAVTVREKPHHFTLTPGKMMAAGLTGPVGGAITGAVADSEGQQQIAKNKVANPNDLLRRETKADLIRKTGLKEVPAGRTTKSLDAKEIAGEHPHADYVLDCFTASWMGIYYPFTFNKYRIVYTAKMQLVEVKSGRVVAEGFNVYQGDDRDNAPDYDGIYADNAAFLKAETAKGTSGSIAKFKSLF